jgi:dTDP-4-dehydrorhamnose reductase
MTVARTGAHQVLVLGGEGQLAQALRQVAWPAGLDPVFLGHARCDVTDRAAVRSALDTHAPVAVINTSAYTNVDRAEAEEDKAALTNATGPRILAQLCQEQHRPLIHISTDYVFDGQQDVPYTELSEPAPLNAYGRTKLAGDRAIAEETERYLIFRASWLYSERAGNFVSKILELARTRPELQVVADQIGCPTYALDLARAISIVLPRCIDDDADVRGLFNFANAGETSWFDFARAIVASQAGRSSGDQISPVIKPVTSAFYGAAANRPRYSVLDCRKAGEILGIVAGDWRDSLAECLARRSA